MRRFLWATISVLGLLAAAISPTMASSVAKLGAVCLKLNQTTNSNGFKLVCMKSGKKLVWSGNPKSGLTQSGISRITLPISPTQTVQSTIETPAHNVPSTPNAASQGGRLPFDAQKPQENQKCDPSIPSPIGYKSDLNTLVYLSCGPDGNWHPSINVPTIDQNTGLPLANEDSANIQQVKQSQISSSSNPYAQVFESAFNSMWNYLAPSQSEVQSDFVVQSDFPADAATNIELGAKFALSTLVNIVPSSTIYTSFLATTNDFAKTSIGKWATTYGIPNSQSLVGLLNSSDYLFGNIAQNGRIDASGYALEGIGNQAYPGIIYCIGQSSTETAGDAFRVGMGEVEMATNQLLSRSYQQPNLPSWVPEGVEALYVSVFGSGTQDLNSSWGNFVNDNFMEVPNGPHDLTLYDQNNGSDDYLYVISKEAITYLVAKYGAEKVFQFMNEVGLEGNWQTGFQTTFGTSFTTFNKEVKGYLDWFTQGLQSGVINTNSFG